MFPERSLPKDAARVLRLLRTRREKEWMRRGELRALKLFREMAARVPAYKDFLAKNGVRASQVKTIRDFGQVPLTNKENYLLSYPLESLCWDGNLKRGRWVIASTSGSTGEPFYFPRTRYQDDQFALTAELCFLDFFAIDRKSTLFINCFALGVWIGGMFMYEAVKSIIDGDRYALSMITPGADKTEALKAVRNLAPQFDQIIIGGYAPLVKDLIDEGAKRGLDWSRYDMKYFFAAEGFTEGLRDYIGRRGGVKNVLAGTFNHYGTADLGTMANETPLSILIRRLATGDPIICRTVFPETDKQPTLAQYIPELFFFEETGGRLACSACGGLPLLRYDLKDRGGIRTLEEMNRIFAERGTELAAELRTSGLGDPWNLPFVYLYERDDLTVSIYSVNIYPESIRKALQSARFEDRVSGKFSMSVDYNEEQNQFLEINVELKEGVAPDGRIEAEVLAAIIEILERENSEWRDFYADPGIRHKVIPKIMVWPYHDPLHFRPGGKQKWVKKKQA